MPASAPAELDLPEPEEIGNSFADNADLKAREAADLQRPAGARRRQRPVRRRAPRPPGIFSARWAEDEDGNRDWMRAMEKVWREVEATEPDAAPAAHFACALAIAWPNDGQAETFEGRVDGTLVWPPRGDKGFGYDPMFVPAGYELTFGEMEPDEKHHISHRADAFRKFVAALQRMTGEPLALYVHWPFCVSKCPYCDFNSHVRSSIDQDGVARRPARRPRA